MCFLDVLLQQFARLLLCLLFEEIASQAWNIFLLLTPLSHWLGEPSNSYSLLLQGAAGRTQYKEEEYCLEKELLGKNKDHSKTSTDTFEIKIPHFKISEF